VYDMSTISNDSTAQKAFTRGVCSLAAYRRVYFGTSPRKKKAGLGGDPSLTKISKNAEQGAATSVWAATASALEGQGGKYLEDC
jgi:hypothetical protein